MAEREKKTVGYAAVTMQSVHLVVVEKKRFSLI